MSGVRAASARVSSGRSNGSAKAIQRKRGAESPGPNAIRFAIMISMPAWSSAHVGKF